MPKVSIIVPIFKASSYIERCTMSLLQQTLKDIEIIFIDDAGNDGSIDIIHNATKGYTSLNRSIKIISHNHTKGVAMCRNEGIEAAEGEFIGWCDADDYIDPHMFETMYIKAKESFADLVYCDYYLSHGHNQYTVHHTPSYTNKKFFINQYLKERRNPLWNTLAARRLYRSNHLNFIANSDLGEDLYLTVKLYFLSASTVKVELPLYHYTIDNPNSLCHNTSSYAAISLLNNVHSLYKFFVDNDVLDDYNPALSHILLKAKRHLLFENRDIKRYMEIEPRTHRYLFSNPYDGIKAKLSTFAVIQMYTLSQHLLSINL